MYRVDHKKSGFTIVELLIVIVVIGILAALAFSIFAGAKERANIARAQSDMKLLESSIKMATVNTSSPLLEVTGNRWTMGDCFNASQSTGAPLYTLDKTHSCWVNYLAALDAIGAAAGNPGAIEQLKKGDPWGSPYQIDENETDDYPSSDPCTRDYVVSAGKSGIPFSATTIRYDFQYMYLTDCPD